MTEIHRAVVVNINKWFYFCMNYDSGFVEIGGEERIVPTFFNAFPKGIRQHLHTKFNDIYNRYGCFSAVQRLYAELDSKNRRRLIDWFITNYEESDDHGIDLD